MRFFPFLLILLIFTSCAGGPFSFLPWFSSSEKNKTEDTPASPFFTSMPSGNSIVFIGTAGRRSKPDESIQLALEDAARRVSVYNNVTGEYAVVHNAGSGAFDYVHETSSAIFFDKDGAGKYVGNLKYNAETDVILMENTYFVRTTYSASLPYPLNYRPKYSGEDKKPDWINKPPHDLNGYVVGVGYSGRHSSMADTFTNSWINAIYDIIRSLNTAVVSEDTMYQSDHFLGYKTSNDNILYSYGTLSGFYALDIWIDPKTKAIWTLAIAGKRK